LANGISVQIAFGICTCLLAYGICVPAVLRIREDSPKPIVKSLLANAKPEEIL